MTQRIITFDHLAGAECRYARAPVSPYGTLGSGPRRQRLTAEFHATLTAALEELWSIHPWGRARYIVSAGAMVPQSERRGAKDPHVRGVAYDIDAIWWADGFATMPDSAPYPIHTFHRGLITLDAPKHWPNYLAIQCILARHMGIVLGHDYNEAHRDHWHVDSTRPVEFHATSRMCVVLLQRCLNEIWGVEPALKVDGKWGPLTQSAVSPWLSNVMPHPGGLSGGRILDWPDWLLETARRGLAGL